MSRAISPCCSTPTASPTTRKKVVGDLENATQVQTGGGGLARFIHLVEPAQRELQREGAADRPAQLRDFIESGSIAQNRQRPHLHRRSSRPPRKAANREHDAAVRQPTMSRAKSRPAEEGPSPPSSPANSERVFPMEPPPKASAKEGGADAKEGRQETRAREARRLPQGIEDHVQRSSSSPTPTGSSTLLGSQYTSLARPPPSVFQRQPRLRRNTIEFLGGSQDLISIRGKGTSAAAVHCRPAKWRGRCAEKISGKTHRPRRPPPGQVANETFRTAGQKGRGQPPRRHARKCRKPSRISRSSPPTMPRRASRNSPAAAPARKFDALENNSSSSTHRLALLVIVFGIWFHPPVANDPSALTPRLLPPSR